MRRREGAIDEAVRENMGAMRESLIISSSGIRGIVGRGLTPEVAARYGAAFAVRAAAASGPASPRARVPGAILVGRDSRTSGSMLLAAAAAGVRAAGVDVRDLGIVPTPTALLAVGSVPDAIGGLLVTASHNPAEWNGFKLVSGAGRFLDADSGREVQRCFEGDIEYASHSEAGGLAVHSGAGPAHIERILSLSLVDRRLIAAQRFHIALDCVRGAGGVVLPQLLERLGCRVTGLDLEPDGRFPRLPEPVPENLGELAELVRTSGADAGFAVDPDADRLALVDETGRPMGEDWTLALAVEEVCGREPGPVVTNLSSSRCIQDAADRAGVPFYRAPVSEANVVARMLEVGACIGGEGNGGVIYPGLHLTRDAPLAAALALQLLAERQKRLSELVAGMPSYRLLKRKIPRGNVDVERAIASIAAAAPPAAADLRDGARVDWPDGSWVHARPSGTEPVFRIIAEAEREETARARIEWVEELVRRHAA